MAAPIDGSKADESKLSTPSNVHIPSIFDITTTRPSTSAAGTGGGDGKELDRGAMSQLTDSHLATPPRRAYRAKMGDVAIDVIKEREQRRNIRREAELQRIAAGIPGYNKACYERRPQNKLRNVLTRMEECTTGPLSLLYHSVKENRKVKVWTRSCKSVRGICTGYVVAYDKHWNLAMCDVDETYKNPVVKRKASSDRWKQKKKRLKKRTQQDVETEENYKKTDEVKDNVDAKTEKLMVEQSSDVKHETTMPEMADIKHVTSKDTYHCKTTPTMMEHRGNRTPVREKEHRTSEEQSLKTTEIGEDDEEDLESLALKLSQLKEELGEISFKEEQPNETLPGYVKPATYYEGTEAVDMTRDAKQVCESSHLDDNLGTMSKQTEYEIDDISKPEVMQHSIHESHMKEEIKTEGQDSDNRSTVREGKHTASSNLQTDDTDRNTAEDEAVLERHVNQLFIRGDNIVMVSLVPLH